MKRVGDALAATAVQSGSTDDADLFGRSAINRYYYACFLDTRAVVLRIRPGMQIKHKQLPTNIKGTVAETVRREIARLQRQNMISFQDATTYRATLNGVVSSWAEILEKAYRLRVIADYRPEIRAVKVATRIVLNGTSNTDAMDWHRKTVSCVDRIRKLWSDLGH